MAQISLGERLKYFRDQKGMSQDDLAKALKFESRQIVSNIENGVRKISGEELVACAEFLDVKLVQFTNPYSLVGQGAFSWRQSNVDPAELYAFEARAGEWIGAYRVLKEKLKVRPRAILPEVRLTKKSSYEDAVEVGESVALELDLGDIPAKNLSAVIEEKLNTIVLMADPHRGISGAACRLPEMNAIIINRQEPLSRRNFDLAHEIFHLLTWEAMPPAYLDSTVQKKNRIEQLADKFASGLLLPSFVVAEYLSELDETQGEFVQNVNIVATKLMVSSQALLWRLVDLGKLDWATCKKYAENDEFKFNGGLLEDKTPTLFSSKFLGLMSDALKNGMVSERRISSLLDLSFEEIEDLYRQNGLENPLGS